MVAVAARRLPADPLPNVSCTWAAPWSRSRPFLFAASRLLASPAVPDDCEQPAVYPRLTVARLRDIGVEARALDHRLASPQVKVGPEPAARICALASESSTPHLVGSGNLTSGGWGVNRASHRAIVEGVTIGGTDPAGERQRRPGSTPCTEERCGILARSPVLLASRDLIKTPALVAPGQGSGRQERPMTRRTNHKLLAQREV